jgi:hypothetical protein
MLPDFYLLVKNSWLRIGDIVSLSDLLASSEKAKLPRMYGLPPDCKEILGKNILDSADELA